jgi:citrate synthase
MTTTLSYIPGLEGVIAAETALSHVDGLKGELCIAGYPVEEFASQAKAEEVIWLLWKGQRPTEQELKKFQRDLGNYRSLSALTLDLLREAAVQELEVMDALKMAVGTLDLPKNALSMEEKALKILAQTPVIIATYWRLLQGEAVLFPRPEYSQAANYLYLLQGVEPSVGKIRALETYLNTVIDHGLNASTFTARVILSTQSDLLSAIVGALGALKGPLHGGAPGPALEMVFEIGKPENAEAYLREKLRQGKRLMGFGHRVYKVRDPRAEVLAKAAQTLFKNSEDLSFYELACSVEKTALRLLEEVKPGRSLQTNVEYYTALLLHGLGLPPALFTPTFALSRTAGWIAHGFEQVQKGRLIRPSSSYCGPVDLKWNL